MSIQLTNEESGFLIALMIERSQDANLAQQDNGLPVSIFKKITGLPMELSSQETSFTQSVLQEQSEIWGRSSSTANEKQPVSLGSFVPQKTRQLIKSISDKLGAKISVDVTERSFSISPRGEGSISIMQDPRIVEKER